MEKRELVFEIREIKSRYNHSMPDNREDYIHTTTGIVNINGDEILVFVDDKSQPHEMFEAKDSFFKKVIKKISEAVK